MKYKSEKIIEYKGQYPEPDEFQNPLEYAKCVCQGGAKESHKLPLISEGFACCSALIIFNKTQSIACFAHFDYLKDITLVKPFLEKEGEKLAIFVYGTHSNHRADIEQILSSKKETYKVTILPPLEVETGEPHFTVVFYPKTKCIKIAKKKPKHLMVYDPFSKYLQEVQSEGFFARSNANGKSEIGAGIKS